MKTRASIDLTALATAITIDFEAEPGHRGELFPTEVGLSWVGGRTRSCFIQPDPVWHLVENNHPEPRLIPAAVVGRHIAAHSEGRLLISDACFVDQPLLDMVMDAAGLPKITLEGFFPLLERASVAAGIAMTVINRWIVEIDETRGEAHRAGEDARVRAELLHRLVLSA